MAQSSVARLAINVGLDASDVKKGASRAVDALEDLRSKVGSLRNSFNLGFSLISAGKIINWAKHLAMESDASRVTMEKLQGSINDIAMHLGSIALPTVMKFADGMRAVADWVVNLDIKTLEMTAKVVAATAAFAATVSVVPKLIAAGAAIVRVFKAIAQGQAIIQALAGPKGWAQLAAGLVAAGAAVAGVEMMFDNYANAAEVAVAANDQFGQSVLKIGNNITFIRDKVDKTPWWMPDNQTAEGKAYLKQLEESGRAVDDWMKTLEDRGKSMAESLRTPMEVLRDEMESVNGLILEGAISWQTYSRQIEKLENDFKTAIESKNKLQASVTPGVGAATRFSTAGFSAVQESNRMLEAQKRAEDTRKNQHAVTNQRLAEAVRGIDRIRMPPTADF